MLAGFEPSFLGQGLGLRRMKRLERRRLFDLLDQAETRIQWECGGRRRKRKAGENVGEQVAGLPFRSTEFVCENAQVKEALAQEGLGQENEPIRLLGVDSAAMLTQDSGWGSQIVISGRAWQTQSTDFSNGASPSNSCTASEILVESSQDCSFVGLGDVSDVEEQEEDCSDFVPLVTMCSELSLDDKFLEASTPPHFDECGRPKPDEENNKRNEDSCQWFYGNVAKIGKRDQAEVLDAWIHYFYASSTEPFRLAVLLLAKASIQNSGSKNLAFPEIAREYLTTWPPSRST